MEKRAMRCKGAIYLTDSENHYDLIILGGGCAGLTAAIYASRAKLKTLILENAQAGGQILYTNEIENYPGFTRISGAELAEAMRKQSSALGAVLLSCQVGRVTLTGDIKEIATDNGSFYADAVILATGAAPKRLDFEGEEQFQGRGVSYCATCDGFFYRDGEVIVVGGGSSAAVEALLLAKLARKVTVLVRGDALRCEKILAEQLMNESRIEVRFHSSLVRVWGDAFVENAEILDSRTGEKHAYLSGGGSGRLGIFIFVGYVPATGLFSDQLLLTKDGCIVTDEIMRTALPGVFAAGDVREKELRQIVTAAADGAIAAAQAESYLFDLRR